jgi:hypothetical protein
VGRCTSTPIFLVISWLALVLAGVLTGDFVEDLAFEPMELTDTSETVPSSDEPDEHILMPSPRADSPGDGTVLRLFGPADAHLRCLEPFVVPAVAEFARPYLKGSCRPRPPSSVQVTL